MSAAGLHDDKITTKYELALIYTTYKRQCTTDPKYVGVDSSLSLNQLYLQ